jgi:hypothetical protein
VFDLFKSKARREKEAQVDRIGRNLFRQIALFRDKCRDGEFTADVFKERANHSYTAGYLIGFIDEKLSTLFDSDVEKSKYMTTVITGIFPKTGVSFLQTKYTARVLAKDLCSTDYATRVEGHADAFDLGIENGRQELLVWEDNPDYTPHLLTDFLMTGKINKAQPSH